MQGNFDRESIGVNREIQTTRLYELPIPDIQVKEYVTTQDVWPGKLYNSICCPDDGEYLRRTGHHSSHHLEYGSQQFHLQNAR